jgi:hypothetical protein
LPGTTAGSVSAVRAAELRNGDGGRAVMVRKTDGSG